MNTSTDTSKLHQELRDEFAQLLGVHVDKLPGDVTPETASKFLGNATRTLSIWRSTGRYNLEFYKAGRMVRYRVLSLIRFKASRIHRSASEAA